MLNPCKGKKTFTNSIFNPLYKSLPTQLFIILGNPVSSQRLLAGSGCSGLHFVSVILWPATKCTRPALRIPFACISVHYGPISRFLQLSFPVLFKKSLNIQSTFKFMLHKLFAVKMLKVDFTWLALAQ